METTGYKSFEPEEREIDNRSQGFRGTGYDPWRDPVELAGLGLGVLGFGFWGLGFGVWVLEPRVHGLGFGVWGFGSRVSGLGSRV